MTQSIKKLTIDLDNTDVKFSIPYLNGKIKGRIILYNNSFYVLHNEDVPNWNDTCVRKDLWRLYKYSILIGELNGEIINIIDLHKEINPIKNESSKGLLTLDLIEKECTIVTIEDNMWTETSGKIIKSNNNQLYLIHNNEKTKYKYSGIPRSFVFKSNYRYSIYLGEIGEAIENNEIVTIRLDKSLSQNKLQEENIILNDKLSINKDNKIVLLTKTKYLKINQNE